MTDLFFEKIITKTLKTPTQKGFSIKKWHKNWSQLENSVTRRDKNIYKSGVIINELLSEIRDELKNLYKNGAPEISNEKLVQAYISLSNRDRSLASASDVAPQLQGKNIFSVTKNNNAMNNNITIQEISEASVDGIEKATYFCIDRIKKGQDIIPSENPLDIVDFIIQESYLSQLYAMYEGYWQAILWSDYELIELDELNKVFCVRQPVSTVEIGSLISQMRKSRLSAQSAMIASNPNIMSLFNKDKYIGIGKVGRKKTIKTLTISDAPEIFKYYNSDWRVKQNFLVDQFSSDSIKSEFSNGFSINDCLDVFRCLMILSNQLNDNYPDNDGFFNIKKLLEFCPKVKKIDLAKSLTKATGHSFGKVNKILNFIEYNANSNEDLWCHPIISISDLEYCVVTSALLSPVIIRVVEHWMVSLGIELKSKGFAYEENILESLNQSLAENIYVNDYDKATSKIIKLPGKRTVEEIDLLVRVGRTVLVGEAKSIITADSPISEYNTIQTLKGAAKQVNRKADFVENNIELVFDRLGWNFEKEGDYNVIKIIINSGGMYVGFEIDGVPVCDSRILNNYFNEDIVPLISVTDDETHNEKHLAWFKLYDDFTSLQENMSKYFSNPPQISENESYFEYGNVKMPYIKSTSNKIIFERLIPKNMGARERIDAKHVFPLKTVDNIDEIINEFHYSI